MNAQAEVLDLTDMQGLLVRGYGGLPFARYLLLGVTEPAGARVLLGQWATEVTAADRAPTLSAMNLALTAAGISALRPAGLPDGFSEQFRSGMTTATRSRVLHDVGPDDPRGWAWGGPATPPVHLLMMLFATTESELDARVTEQRRRLSEYGMALVNVLSTDKVGEREHFGFHDGISQPLMAGLPRASSGEAVQAGEFVLGYLNEYGQRTERPLLPRAADPSRLLPLDADGSGTADLGRNGSYLAFRQLSQDVDAFESYLDDAGRRPDGTVDDALRAHVAARIVGRWPSGAPLVLRPDHDDPSLSSANDFGYQSSDPLGQACPIGSHVRRSNPRDTLPPSPGTAKSMAVNRRHRLLRRGRNYSGSGSDTGRNPDQPSERGIHFISINANLSRQFEFVQHSWINDPSFNGLRDSSDPLVGVRSDGGSSFSIPGTPLRRRLLVLPQFVRVRGGAYFFLPGLRALQFLASDA